MTRSNEAAQALSEVDEGREWLSALVDGECPGDQLDAVFSACAGEAVMRQAWNDHHLVGQLLRGGTALDAQPASPGFVAAVMAGIDTESAPAVPVVRGRAWPDAAVPSVTEAANEAVFRWKLVAGVASLAAVAALGWQLTMHDRAGPELAQGSSPTVTRLPQPVLEVSATAAPGGGVVWRDPQLEALMAAHRQLGSVSALQAPAGFLRNATYEVPQR